MKNKAEYCKAIDFLKKTIDADDLKLTQTSSGTPSVRFCLAGYPQQLFSLRDERIIGLLMTMMHNGEIGPFHVRDIRDFIAYLEGLAMKTTACFYDDVSVITMLERDPVLAVVYEWAMEKTIRPKETQAAIIWKECRQLARERGCLKFGAKQFPAGPNVFSRRLRQMKQSLADLGIDLTWRRSNGCHFEFVRRVDDTDRPSSDEPSASNPQPQPEFEPTDDENRLLKLVEETANLQSDFSRKENHDLN